MARRGEMLALSDMSTAGRPHRTGRRTLVCVLVLVWLLSLSASAPAAPPNDNFADATEITGLPAEATGSTVDATREPDEPVPGDGSATREFGEPEHNPANANTTPSEGSVWYSWTAPADRLVRLRVCGTFGVVAVYGGSRVDSLTWVATRRGRDGRCASLAGASVTFSAAQGEVYRIAVTSPGESFQLLLGNQVAVIAGPTPAFLYTAFSGQVDNVKLRLMGSRGERALLVEADGVAVANGCQADVAAGRLRCPVPGEAAVAVDVDLGDGHDAADVRLLGLVRPSSEGGPSRRVLGGDGNDTLAGWAGSYSLAHGWTGGLALVGGPGADGVAGGPGDESLSGGPGPDKLDPGKGSDSADGGPGDDRVWARDGASDSIRCQAGRDRARIDGIDLPQRCERRKLTGPARAVATSAAASNDNREDDDHLEIYIACPIDVKSSCRSRVTPAVPGERRISRPLRLAPGRTGTAEFYRFNEDQLVRRGVSVTVTTQRRGRRLKFTDHLAVPDIREYGE
jgi:hypothetical protein